MAILLTENDCREISEKLPTLNCILSNGVIWGTLEINCRYDSVKREIIYEDSDENHIRDTYEVKIDFNEKDTFGFPKVYETSGIVREFARSESLRLEDMHINKDDSDSCCLGIFPEYRWTSSWRFIVDKVIPFFYWQSFRRINGRIPWKGYSHGKNGIIEAMCLPPQEVSKGGNRNKPCPCKSERKYKHCCLRQDTILKSGLVKYTKL